MYFSKICFYFSDFWSNGSGSCKLWCGSELLDPGLTWKKMYLKASYAAMMCPQKPRASSDFKGWFSGCPRSSGENKSFLTLNISLIVTT